MLAQYERNRENFDYNLTLLLTDKGSFELSEKEKTIPTLIKNVYIVHLDDIAIGYDDLTLKVVENGGIARR